MRKKSLLSLLLILSVLISYSQSSNLEKKLAKAYKYCEKEKYEDADEYMVELLNENPQYGDGWDLLGKIRYQLYVKSKKSDNLFGNITITTKDSTSTKDIKNDSLANVFMEMLSNIKPSKSAYDKYIFTLRKATLFSNEAYYSSMALRINKVDIEVDTNISPKALKYYNIAEEEFSNKNLEKASKYYKRALEEQPEFYKAYLYYGDMFFLTGDVVKAIKVFKEIIEKYPNLLEPRKYLTDAFAKDRLYKDALDEAIKSMCVYPDLSMSNKLSDAAFLNNQKLDIKWTPRQVFPNVMAKDTLSKDYSFRKEVPLTKAPWDSYVAAYGKIKDYCNEKGKIFKINKLTNTKYLEVYSWEEMLANSKDPSLDEARRMQTDGYLDCYVFTSCFHYDLLDQFKDFVSKNQPRIIEYYNKYIISK
ncbi:MAG: tetratricopeptide repeat protein [Bacteroidales bacterium]